MNKLHLSRIAMGGLTAILALHAAACDLAEPAVDAVDSLDQEIVDDGFDQGPDEVNTADPPAGEFVAAEPAGGPADVIAAEPIAGVEGNFTGSDVVALDAPAPLDDAAVFKEDAAFAAAATCSGGAGPTSRELAVNQVGQTKGYYCGPASGYMILDYLKRKKGGPSKSKKNNASLSQANLAKSAHMNTDGNNGTPWTSKNFVKGLNAFYGQNWYVQVNRPSSSSFKAALVHSIGGNGYPVAADTVEMAGGVHYNGHPSNRTIGHWIVAYRYTSCGATAYFADPSTTVFSNANAKFSYDGSLFASRFLQNNGIAY
jgi:hypothetical protein